MQGSIYNLSGKYITAFEESFRSGVRIQKSVILSFAPDKKV